MIWLVASLSTLVKILLEKMFAMLLSLLLKSLPFFLAFYRLEYFLRGLLIFVFQQSMCFHNSKKSCILTLHIVTRIYLFFREVCNAISWQPLRLLPRNA